MGFKNPGHKISWEEFADAPPKLPLTQYHREELAFQNMPLNTESVGKVPHSLSAPFNLDYKYQSMVSTSMFRIEHRKRVLFSEFLSFHVTNLDLVDLGVIKFS